MSLKEMTDFVAYGHPWGLFFLIAIFHPIGKIMVEPFPNARRWSDRLAAFTFVAYFCYRLTLEAEITTGTAAVIAFQAALAAGLIRGASWIILSIMAFFCDLVFLRPWRCLSASLRYRKLRRAEERRRREEEARQRARDLEWERLAPVRERVRIENEQRSRVVAAKEAQSQTRRDAARMQCELLWTLHGDSIRDRFRRVEFDAFVMKYMGDHHPPEYVEERAAILKDTIERIAEGNGSSRKFRSVSDVLDYFDQTRTTLQSAPIEENYREYLLSRITNMQEDAIEKLITGEKKTS